MNSHTIKYLKKNLDEVAVLGCLADLAFSSGFELNEENQTVLAALRRSSEEFKYSSVDEIGERLSHYCDDQIAGLVNNVKGIAHEMEFVKIENDDGDSIYAHLYSDTNHAGYDLQMFDENTGEQWDVQLKATDNISYVNQWIEQHPDGEMLITDELAAKMDLNSSGINNGEITTQVEEFVDKLIEHNDVETLSSYFPLLAIASVSMVIYELWKRYRCGEISYLRFKFLAKLAAGKKSIKLGLLVGLLSMPVVDVVVGAAMVAKLIYSANGIASVKLGNIKFNKKKWFLMN